MLLIILKIHKITRITIKIANKLKIVVLISMLRRMLQRQWQMIELYVYLIAFTSTIMYASKNGSSIELRVLCVGGAFADFFMLTLLSKKDHMKQLQHMIERKGERERERVENTFKKSVTK